MNAGDDHCSAQQTVETQWAYEDSIHERGIESERAFFEQTAELRSQRSQRNPAFMVPQRQGRPVSPAPPDPAVERAEAERRRTGVVSTAGPATVAFSPTSVASTGPTNPPAISSDDHTCVVCYEWPCEITLLYCGHQCVCITCYQRLETCPLCRGEIRGSYRNQ